MYLSALLLTITSFLQPVPNAVATFDGTFKVSNGKFIEVQMESGETLRMYLTRATKFIRDGKPTKAATFHEGDKVTIDAERDVRFNLLAVKLEAVKSEPAKPK